MTRRLARELERPSRTPSLTSAVGARDRISATRSRFSVRRESEGAELPLMAVQHNAVGGKGPYFVYAFRCRYARVNAGDG